jgi:hypothetical protein
LCVGVFRLLRFQKTSSKKVKIPWIPWAFCELVPHSWKFKKSFNYFHSWQSKARESFFLKSVWHGIRAT